MKAMRAAANTCLPFTAGGFYLSTNWSVCFGVCVRVCARVGFPPVCEAAMSPPKHKIPNCGRLKEKVISNLTCRVMIC